MKLIALAVLLAIMQSVPPVPRQPTDDSASAGSKIQSQAKSEKAPAQKSAPSVNAGQPSTLAASEDQTQRHDSAGSGQRNDNTEHSVNISKPPAVTIATPKRDWADWGYWAFNLCLAVVGGLQVLLLCWTLRVVRHQSHEMTRQRVFIGRQLGTMNDQLGEMAKQTAFLEKYVGHTETTANAAMESAVAAKASADALINSERAWVMVSVGWAPGAEMGLEGTGPDYTVNITLRYKNDGKTPAWIIERRGCLRIIDGLNLSEKPDLEATEVLQHGTVSLAVGQVESLDTPLTCKGCPTFDNATVVYGIVRYRNAFGGTGETYFGYKIPFGSGVLERLDGWPEYNKNT